MIDVRLAVGLDGNEEVFGFDVGELDTWDRLLLIMEIWFVKVI